MEVERALRDIFDRLERIEKPDVGTPSGTTFPTGIASGFLFFRTDYNFLCVYDGTRWLTVHEYTCEVGFSQDLTTTYSATANAIRRGGLRSDTFAPHFTRVQTSTTLGAGTSNSSNYWTVSFVTTTTVTTIWSFDTKTDTASASTSHATNTMTAQSNSTEFAMRLDIAKTGAPPTISPVVTTAWYRLVLT